MFEIRTAESGGDVSVQPVRPGENVERLAGREFTGGRVYR